MTAHRNKEGRPDYVSIVVLLNDYAKEVTHLEISNMAGYNKLRENDANSRIYEESVSNEIMQPNTMNKETSWAKKTIMHACNWKTKRKKEGTQKPVY